MARELNEDDLLDIKQVRQVIAALVEIRVANGLSQREVGRRMGVGQQTISQFENGRTQTPNYHTPFLGTLQRYARAVGAEIDFEVVPDKGTKRKGRGK